MELKDIKTSIENSIRPDGSCELTKTLIGSESFEAVLALLRKTAEGRIAFTALKKADLKLTEEGASKKLEVTGTAGILGRTGQTTITLIDADSKPRTCLVVSNLSGPWTLRDLAKLKLFDIGAGVDGIALFDAEIPSVWVRASSEDSKITISGIEEAAGSLKVLSSPLVEVGYLNFELVNFLIDGRSAQTPGWQ